MEEVEGSPRRVRSSSISSMSQLLLQGWAMLADCCEECGVRNKHSLTVCRS